MYFCAYSGPIEGVVKGGGKRQEEECGPEECDNRSQQKCPETDEQETKGR